MKATGRRSTPRHGQSLLVVEGRRDHSICMPTGTTDRAFCGEASIIQTTRCFWLRREPRQL
ncbi:hypothetical protein E2C01_080046 [Portunus trituberculatus]|uniref:Uncharacterized protein n=1 Tax=Portunus trituberculatus TaxID=210409 RepID=A0A5B7IIH4_PORTR|nr:hypothetical protein [Portunus trituberculatus]